MDIFKMVTVSRYCLGYNKETGCYTVGHDEGIEWFPTELEAKQWICKQQNLVQRDKQKE